MPDDNEVLTNLLRTKHPGAFEGWDEFEIKFMGRQRKGSKPEMLVVLYNAGTDGMVVDIHSCFLLTSDDDGGDVIRVGKSELYAEWNDIYIPDQYREENLR